MEALRIPIRGIVRNRAANEFADGECQEIINMRFRDKAWRPVPDPLAVKTDFGSNYEKMWIHVYDTNRNYLALDNTGQLLLVDMETGATTLVKNYAGETIDVKFLKRYMIVTGTVTDVFLLRDGVYSLVTISNINPFVFLYPEFTVQDSGTAEIDTGETSERVIGKYREKVAEFSQKGMFVGTVAYRFAFKMYDGSFIMHSTPQLIWKDNKDYQNYFLNRQGIVGPDPIKWKNIRGTKVTAKYPALAVYDNVNKDIISSLCIFFCQPQERYTIDETTITFDMLKAALPSGINNASISSMGVPLNSDYDKLADAQGWYLVHEIPIDELQNLTSTYSKEIDLKGFMTDFAARQRLPVDNFSHHSLAGGVSYIYNDRLILADTIRKFGSVQIGTEQPFYQSTYIDSTFFSDYTLNTTKPAVVVATIKTADGEIKAYTEVTNLKIFAADGDYHVIMAGGGYSSEMYSLVKIVGYPDARATKIEIWIDNTTSYMLFGSFALKKSENGNYAYYHAENYDDLILTDSVINRDDGSPDLSSDSERDENRVQVSELQNPFVFPAVNSYQVGTGKILAMGANTEPLSTGQFGEYPLSVFTTKGIWALEQGQGVVFARISPVSGDVLLNGNQVVSTGNGVIFTTHRGVFAVAGKQIAQISEPVEGLVRESFMSNEHLNFLLTDSRLVQLFDNLCEISFNDYLSSAKLGYDKVNSELYVSSDEYDAYSYVYNFESMTWHKVSEYYRFFVSDYPELLGMSDSGLYNVSMQSSAEYRQILIITQPQWFQAADILKRLDRTALRCTVNVNSAKYCTLAVFASNDLETWQIITGAQRESYIKNILLSRSHGSAQYYIFVISGEIKTDSNFTSIDVAWINKLNRKLRK